MPEVVKAMHTASAQIHFTKEFTQWCFSKLELSTSVTHTQAIDDVGLLVD